MMKSNLPLGWSQTKVGLLSELIRGISYQKHQIESEKNSNNCLVLRGGNIQDGKIIDTSDNVYVPKHIVQEKQLLKKGDVIVVSSTGSTTVIGKAASAIEDSNEVGFGAFLTLIRPNKLIEKQYFNYFFQTDFYRKTIRQLVAGVNINNIKSQHINDLEFPLPPLAEQKRIVAKLDDAFKCLDSINTRLGSIPKFIQSFKRSVLSQAITGKLTKDWRDENQVSPSKEAIEEHILLDKSLVKTYYTSKRFESSKNPWQEFPVVPSEWIWVTAAEIVESKAEIVYGIVQPGPKLAEGIPYIRGTDIQDGKILIHQLLKTSPIIAKRYERASLKENDILLGIIRSTKVAKVPKELEGANITQGTARLRPSKFILPEFMEFWLLSDMIQSWLHSHYRGIDMPGLNLIDVRKIPFAIPAIEEQQEIVNRVNALFSKANFIESQFLKAKEKIDKLPRAILAKAFKGDLVPQDPNDEPASTLLKSIQQQKLAKGKSSKEVTQQELFAE